MPFMDSQPPARMDSGLRFDAASAPVPNPTTPMAEARRNLSRKALEERVQTLVYVTGKIEDDTVLAPKVANLAALLTKVADVETRFRAIEDLATQLKAARAAFGPILDDCVKEFYKATGAVEGAVLGDPAQLIALGYEVITEGATVAAIMTQVLGLAATSGDDDGEIDLHWNRVVGAMFYEIESSTDPNNPALWKSQTNSTASKTTIAGLPSGTRLWFRVRAVGTNEQRGPWSDPATKMVP